MLERVLGTNEGSWSETVEGPSGKDEKHFHRSHRYVKTCYKNSFHEYAT